MHRIVIVDDERMIVSSLVLGFDWKRAGFEVIGTAGGGREALELIRRLHPDAVFTDIRMPGMSGLELMTAARALPLPPQFVVISGHAEFTYLQQAIQLGAVAYCLKPLEDEEIIAALEKVAGNIETSAKLRQAALQHFLTAPTAENAAALLDPWHIEGRCTVILSRGRSGSLFDSVGALSFSPMEGFSMHLLAGEPDELESYGFQASMLSAISSGELISWVYDVTDDPVRFLATELQKLSSALYASWFSGRQACLGRYQPSRAAGGDFIVRLAALCNKNRPSDTLQCLKSLTPAEEQALSMSDALRIFNLCTDLIQRLRDLPPVTPLRYGWELATRYASFTEALQSLERSLEQSVSRMYDADILHNETLRSIVSELNRDFATDVSFQDVCARYRINPSYLSQLFKRELGMTFTAYLNSLRIGYAKELLEKTSLLVSEIGDKVGCDSYLSFAKLFKRETGMTPKQYRAESQPSGGAV